MYSNSCHFFDQEWRCCEHLYTVQLGFWNMLVCPLIWHLVHFKPVPKQWNDQHILTDLCLHDINTYKDHQYKKKTMQWLVGTFLSLALGLILGAPWKLPFHWWPNGSILRHIQISHDLVYDMHICTIVSRGSKFCINSHGWLEKKQVHLKLAGLGKFTLQSVETRSGRGHVSQWPQNPSIIPLNPGWFIGIPCDSPIGLL